MPGIESVGITSYLPASGMVSNSSFVADSYAPPKGTELDIAWPSQVMGDYFRAAGIPLLQGREFTPADDAKAPLVGIVNHMLAEHFWPGQDPIGKRLRWGMHREPYALDNCGGRDGQYQADRRGRSDAVRDLPALQPADGLATETWCRPAC